MLPLIKFKSSGASAVFFALSSGLIIFTTIYSITITKGATVNIIIPLLFCIPFFRLFSLSRFQENLSKLTEFVKNHAVILINGFLALILGTLIELIRNDFFNPKAQFLAYSDFFVYARIAEYLNQYGLESTQSHLAQIGYSVQPTIYHYFDVWILAFLHRLSFQNVIDTYLFSYVPISISIIFIGFVAIYKNVYKYRWWSLFFIFPTVYGLCLLPFADIGFTRNLVIAPKIFPAYLAITLSVLLLLKKHYTLFIVVLCSLAVMSITHAPAALATLLLMSVVFYFWGEKKQVLPSIIWPLLTAVLISFFYIISSDSNIQNNISTNSVDHISILSLAKSMVRSVIFSSKLTILPAGLFTIFLIVIVNYKYMKKVIINNKDLFLTVSYLFMFIIMSFGCVALVPLSTIEFIQISRNTINPLYALVSIIILAIVLLKFQSQSSSKIISIMSIIILAIQISYGMYFNMSYYSHRNVNDLPYVSKNFISELSAKLSNHNPCGGYIYTDTTLLKNIYFNNPNLFHLGVFINYVGDNRWLTPLHTLHSSHKYYDQNKTSPFNRFIVEQKKNNDFVSNEQSQLDFIEKNQIGYIVLEKGVVVSDLLKERIEKTIVDPISQVSVIILI